MRPPEMRMHFQIALFYHHCCGLVNIAYINMYEVMLVCDLPYVLGNICTLVPGCME
jgi:hypothetical protein